MSGLSSGVHVSYGDDGLYGRPKKRPKRSINTAAKEAEARAATSAAAHFASEFPSGPESHNLSIAQQCHMRCVMS
jgi:hypothetical protein